MRVVKYFIVIAVALLAAAIIYIYAGIYPMGADVPHNKLSYWLLETVREQSVASASKDIRVPALDDPELLLAGGADYNDMCTACHLKPGQEQSDMSIGLYPKPPNLSLKTKGHGDAVQNSRRQFWIIKHGIKASGMPAWGPTHDDERIWAMVAFLQKLPELTPLQYQIVTARNSSSTQPHH
ncbi:c-type cytochrome [Dasania marina]|uniref:c-type cytochrome n=1 Tax=Dasania marina TaxID=471499 RepID=UPI0003643771|nr:cytochrome c [Dasania marina]